MAIRKNKDKVTKTTEKKTSASTKPVDPFDRKVEKVTKPDRKPAVGKSPGKSKSARPVARGVGVVEPDAKTEKPLASDPFAEVASPNLKKVAEPAPAAKGKDRSMAQADTPIGEPTEPGTEPFVQTITPAFEALADVRLPELQRDNRARLQMQSPTRLYFYWSVKENPWPLLKNVFGNDRGNYTLVVKLIEQNTGLEAMHPIDAEGSWWFDVEPEGRYRAEVGFFATGRPYFRVLYSNTVETPRRSPSSRAASDRDWNVSAHQFAEVLDVAGFSRDAFDVAMAGDDVAMARDASEQAFVSFIGRRELDLAGISSDEIRYALLALASGVGLPELDSRLSPRLSTILNANIDRIDQKKAAESLSEHFELHDSEFVEEYVGAAVYGASKVNFPRTLNTRAVPKQAPRYNPVSSHSLR